MLQLAWQKAQEVGSYSFISDINQTFIPRPVTEMIGQQETALNMALDGAVVLPDQAYSEMRVYSGQTTESVVMLRDGAQSFMLQDGELKPVENALNLASQSNDLLGYLSAADQVTLLDPPEGHPELARYGFVIDGPRYAEYVRQQAEAALLAEPGAPQSLTIQPIAMLQQLSGRGELWVNQDGLPVRQVLEFDIPEVNQEYSAHIQMSADFSAYGKVDALPKAVQGPDGKWLLQGTLTAEAASSLGRFPGFGQLPVQVAASEPENLATVAGWWSHITSTLPLRVSPTAVILFVLILLVVIFISFYRRYPRRCYAFIVFVLIPIMMFSPLLESTGVVKFMERQVQAAEAGRSAVPEFLQALGLDPAMVDVDTTSPSDTADEGDNPSDENPEILTPQAALEQAAASKPEGAPYYDVLIPTVNGSSEEALEICGYGTARYRYRWRPSYRHG